MSVLRTNHTHSVIQQAIDAVAIAGYSGAGLEALESEWIVNGLDKDGDAPMTQEDLKGTVLEGLPIEDFQSIIATLFSIKPMCKTALFGKMPQKKVLVSLS